jgi:glycosyltransferase involved in cell wall biosynthesis
MNHSSFNTSDVTSKVEKVFLKIERHFLYKYFDSIFFASRCFLERALMDSKVPERHQNVAHWGGETEFYYCKKTTPSYYLAIGQAKRDFPTLVAAFEKMPDKQLKILARGEAVLKSINKDRLPNNVEIISNDNDIEHWMRMREIYAGAKATLIAITSNHHFACGSTVLVESLAAATPVFISNVANTFVDVEKERVGKKVGLFDVEGWVRTLNDFESRAEIADEYSKNARKVAEEQYNYKLSCGIIEKELYKLTGK